MLIFSLFEISMATQLNRFKVPFSFNVLCQVFWNWYSGSGSEKKTFKNCQYVFTISLLSFFKMNVSCISTNFIAFFQRVAFGQIWLKLTSGYAENFRCQLVFIMSILFSFGNKRVLSIEQTKFFLLSLSLLSHFIGSNTGYRIWNTIQKTVQYINLPLTTIILGNL